MRRVVRESGVSAGRTDGVPVIEATPSRTAADLDGNVLNVLAPIDFRDIFVGVSAIVGQPYPRKLSLKRCKSRQATMRFCVQSSGPLCTMGVGGRHER